MKGSPCTYIEPCTGRRAEARYYLDRGLRQLKVSSDEAGAEAVEATCPLAAIDQVHSLAEADVSFPPEVLSALRPGEGERLLLVVHRCRTRGGQGLRRLSLLEESRRR